MTNILAPMTNGFEWKCLATCQGLLRCFLVFAMFTKVSMAPEFKGFESRSIDWVRRRATQHHAFPHGIPLKLYNKDASICMHCAIYRSTNTNNNVRRKQINILWGPGYVFSIHNRSNFEDILYMLFYFLYITVRFTKNDRLAGSPWTSEPVRFGSGQNTLL